MNKLLILFFIILSLAGLASCKQKETTLDESLQKSVAWMWKQQSEDGGWHSQTHAVLRDGIVLTPYILFYLLQVPERIFNPQQKSVQKAVDFIVTGLYESMNADNLTLINYPNYSAAYALRVLYKMKRDTSLQHILATYLVAQQFIEHRGFNPDSLVYGGWGYGESDLKKGEHGHVDISHTRRVVQALVESGYIGKKEKAVLRPAISHPGATAQQPAKAKVNGSGNILFFLQGVQRSQEDLRCYEGCISRTLLPYDGGFVSSVVTLATNKSEPVFIGGAGYHYPSYATATCDGFLAMHALGMKDTPAYTDAANWLIRNQHFSLIDGLSPDDPEQWTYIMHYYHLAVRSEAMKIIEPEGVWRDSISRMIITEQLPEGYYLNPIGGVNKEDDPLMATIFCIQAGINVRR